MRIALFIPCFVDLFSPEVGLAAARILTRLGHDVAYPEGQTCCGQPALNSGYSDHAEHLARRLLDLLDREDPDAVVAPSGSCVAALRKVLPHRTTFAHAALGRLFELSEFLTGHHEPSAIGASFPYRVTWHDACHPLRELGIRYGPRRLLDAVEGLTRVEMEYADECCGFGGTFAVKHPEASAGMGERKARAAIATGAEFVASTESSCLMQIGGVLLKMGSPLKPIHLASILGGRP